MADGDWKKHWVLEKGTAYRILDPDSGPSDEMVAAEDMEVTFDFSIPGGATVIDAQGRTLFVPDEPDEPDEPDSIDSES